MSPRIESSADGHTVVLHTATGSHALRLEPAAVRPLHWGEPITLAQAAALDPWQHPLSDSFEGPLDAAEEFPYDGGARFTPSALSVRHPDGAGSVHLRVTGHAIDGDELVVHLDDAGGPLTVALHWRVRPGSDVIERWSVIRHAGDAGVVELTDHAAAAWSLPGRDDYRLSHVTGGWLRETTLHRTPLPIAETRLVSRRGATSHAANPWVMIDDGSGDEVFSAALAVSGSWKIICTRTSSGRCQVLGAAGTDRTVTRLAPGDEVTSGVFAALRVTGGFDAASQAWHDYQRRFVLAHPDELRPVLYNSWEATTFDVSEAGQRALADRAAALGVELFVLDDGWFGARTHDAAGLGDWTPNPQRFPDGLGPLAAYIRNRGMAFGLWVEPEMVNADSDLYRAHPEWVLHEPRLPATEMRNQLVLDFTRPDVREWAVTWLDDLVRATGLTFLKWDFNRAFTEARPGTETGHALGVYEVMDRLRAAHPGLRIEACAGGGGRVDLGVLRRTDQVWTSDNTDAVDRLTIQDGFTQVYAPGVMVNWVTDSPNPLTWRDVPLAYRFHVAMAGVLGIGGDLMAWSDVELAEAAELVARYREVRPVIQHGRLDRLVAREAAQYTLDDDLVVLAWQPVDALPLRGLDPAGTYRDDSGREFTGETLMTAGLPMDFPPGDLSSALVRVGRVRR